MKYLTDLRVILVAISAIALPTDRAIAIGCDTYYRVTGQIGGCSDAFTEYARELWLQRYSFCLQQQLYREIFIYQTKAKIYYAELDKPGSNLRFEY